MKFLKYMVICMTVASCTPAFGTRHVTTKPTADVAAVTKILKDNDVKGGWILSRHIISNCVRVSCEDDKWNRREDFKSVDQIIALLPRLVGSFFPSWSWLRAKFSGTPQYQVTLTFENQPWYKRIFGPKETVSSFCIRNDVDDDFAPAGTI